MTGRWSASRVVAVLLIAFLNVSFGIGVYLFLNASRGALALQAKRPEDTIAGKNAPIRKLPGTLYLVQGGALYRLEKGRFTTVLSPGGWTQPALAAGGQGLVVVKRERWFSDLYLVDPSGQVGGRLTKNVGSNNGKVDTNHWAFYPRVGPDGNTVYYSWDAKDPGSTYNVAFSLWQTPISGAASLKKRWTAPNGYTGGDVQPVPLASGGLVYTKFAYAKETIRSQLWLTTRPGTPGKALTPPEADCAQPALSPDGKRLAMVCTADKQVASLEVAAFDGASLGPRQVIVSGIQGAQPTWAPDGSGLVYLAPSGLAGLFQLWWVPVPKVELPPPATQVPASPAARTAARTAAPASPPPPTATPSPSPSPTPPQQVQLTDGLDFDATSTIAWRG